MEVKLMIKRVFEDSKDEMVRQRWFRLQENLQFPRCLQTEDAVASVAKVIEYAALELQDIIGKQLTSQNI